MYEKLGRMMGRSYEETVQILIRSLKNAESQTRIEIMLTLEKVTDQFRQKKIPNKIFFHPRFVPEWVRPSPTPIKKYTKQLVLA